MGEIILLTGGARSGKSSFAEELAKRFGDKILYVATCIPFDDEMKDRVKKHQEQRPSHWETLEAFKGLGEKILDLSKGCDAVLVDCMTIMITNLMLEHCPDIDHISPEEAKSFEESARVEADSLIQLAKNINIPIILVTNEVGLGVVPEYISARIFRDVAGRVNQILAREAQDVYLCVSGIPVKIK